MRSIKYYSGKVKSILILEILKKIAVVLSVIFTSCALIIALVFSIDYFGRERRVLSSVGEELGIELSGRATMTDFFRRKGVGFEHKIFSTTIYIYLDEADEVLASIESDENWKELPLTDNLTEYIDRFFTPRYPNDDWVEIPDVEKGYYWLYDFNCENANPREDGNLFGNGATINVDAVLAIYDCDTNLLYYTSVTT